MRETVCASEKLMLYADLSYLDFTLETLSSGPIFCKSMALHYAFPFAPRSDGVNAADGAQCPALAVCWSTLGSNKTFHAGQEPVPFLRLKFCMSASPISSKQKSSGQLNKCRTKSWMLQRLARVMAHLLDQVGQLGHPLLLHWALEGSPPLGQAHPPPTAELPRVCNPCTLLKTTRHHIHNMNHLPGAALMMAGLGFWLTHLLVLLQFSHHCIWQRMYLSFLHQHETDYFPGALLWFDDAKHRVEAVLAPFHVPYTWNILIWTHSPSHRLLCRD